MHAGDANETSHRVTRTGNGDRIPVTVRACRNCSLATPDLGKKRFARARQRARQRLSPQTTRSRCSAFRGNAVDSLARDQGRDRVSTAHWLPAKQVRLARWTRAEVVAAAPSRLAPVRSPASFNTASTSRARLSTASKRHCAKSTSIDTNLDSMPTFGLAIARLAHARHGQRTCTYVDACGTPPHRSCNPRTHRPAAHSSSTNLRKRVPCPTSTTNARQPREAATSVQQHRGNCTLSSQGMPRQRSDIYTLREVASVVMDIGADLSRPHGWEQIWLSPGSPAARPTGLRHRYDCLLVRVHGALLSLVACPARVNQASAWL